jgi:hypothetical protein
MRTAALIAGVIAALGGLVMTVLWIVHGGVSQREEDITHASTPVPSTAAGATKTHMPTWMLVVHAWLAGTVLLFWIFYMSNPREYSQAPGFAVVLLAAASAIGLVMYRNWSTDRRAYGESRRYRDDLPAEQSFPFAGVIVHGIAGITMLALVLLIAFGVH